MLTTLVLLTRPSFAQVISVPGDYSTVDEAVDNAIDGDIIEIDASGGVTYRASSTITQQNLTIRGVGGQAIIESQHPDDGAFRINDSDAPA